MLHLPKIFTAVDMRPPRFSLILVFGALGVASEPVAAQQGLSEAQRKAYAKQFQAAPPQGGSASLAELRTLLDAQEMRMSAPADAQRFRAFLAAKPAFRALAGGLTPELGYLLSWNEVALDATALDHYNMDPDSPSPMYAEQFGPARTSRALAIVHLAMFEAINTISRKYQSYKNLQATIISKVGVPVGQITAATASKNRALIEAAYRALLQVYPNKKSLFDNALNMQLPQLGNPQDPTIVLGANIGAEAAKAVIALRCNDMTCFDGSELPDLSSDDFDSNNPLTWHQDPISKLPPALGGNWPRVTPFVISAADAFRSTLRDPRRDILAAEFIAAYVEVKRLGGDPNAQPGGNRWPTPTDRTGAADPNHPNPANNTNQTFVGIFWGYDGTPLLCAPPRLYNMIATSIALHETPITTVEAMSVYLALVNVTLADAGIAAWDGKFHYLYPRPVTYIRALSADNSPEGTRDPRWTPLGAQVSNGIAASRNLTPPFPAYPSGHATFGTALFEAMRSYFTAVDAGFPAAGVPFAFVSDEYNGVNRGPGDQTPRDKVTVHFRSFDEARDLNAQSRIYLGVHWQFDAVDGIKLGKAVADDVFGKFYKPTP
jgi:hypothetical protein